MSGMIKISGNGVNNNPPKIRNFRQEGEIRSTYFDIKYVAEDFENTILRQFIYVNGVKTEITKDVGYEQLNNEFSYRVSDLSLNTRYEVQVEVTDGLDSIRSDIISITTEDYKVYGVRVIENNSNTFNCCTYIEDSIGINPATSTTLGGWEDKVPFNKIKLVGFKNGRVVGQVNPNNKKNYYGGIKIPADVDVMVEIPKIYWDFKTIQGGYELRVSSRRFNSTCDCYAHKVDGIEKDFIYVGAYLGYVENNKLRSKSGVKPTVNKSLYNFRNYAHNVGNGYQQMNWYTLMLLQILYLIFYKNLNSQSALGYGVCSASDRVNTGGTDAHGLIYGTSSYYQPICFLGVENFYGNMYQLVDGINLDDSNNIMVTPNNKIFNYNENDFVNIGTASTLDGYISDVIHTNKGGFLPILANGSSTTNYCDVGYITQNSMARFGGYWGYGESLGCFCLKFGCNPTYTYGDTGARLCYLG